ncbi:hypothetical protein C6499_10260 [Candidatus Poribacteria bacterium]|nr:MAG: hypothetical protein C6499_10260 [Candidatus Poribacteria bacterium]
MTAIAVQTQLTPEEYLAWERKAPFKNEYLAGQILAMSGASRAHNLITGNIFNGLYNQLVNRDCEAYISKMRVKARPITSYFYPDVTRVNIERHFRLGTQWKAIEFQALANVLPLDSIRCELPLGHIYRRVKFTDMP